MAETAEGFRVETQDGAVVESEAEGRRRIELGRELLRQYLDASEQAE